MRSKTNAVFLALAECSFDVVVFVESWLVNSIKDEEFIPPQYTVYRRDRHTSSSAKGGGIIIAMKHHLSSTLVSTFRDQLFELIYCKIKLSINNVLHLFVVYFPPLMSEDNFKDCISTINSHANCVPTQDIVLVIGDFNSNIQWSNEGGDLVPFNVSSFKDILLADTMSDLSLMQFCNVHNLRGNILDLVFGSFDANITVMKSDDLVVKERADLNHFSLAISLTTCLSSILPIKPSYNNNFRIADYDKLNTFFIDSFATFHPSDSSTDYVSLFQNILQDGIKRFVPLRKCKYSNVPPWFTQHLVRLLRRKRKLHHRFLVCKSQYLKAKLSFLRKKCSFLNKILHAQFLMRIEHRIISDPKRFWTFVNSRRKSSGFPKTLAFNGTTAATVSDICNLFADFFESVYSRKRVLPISSHVSNSNQVSFNHLSVIALDDSEVLKGLESLNSNKGAGPDGLPPLFLKNCACSLYKPLTVLFNFLLGSGSFPVAWKSSFVTPIFKSGNRGEAANYRPIAIASCLPKLFESLVSAKIFGLCRNLISSCQHGFFPGRSTVTNLSLFTNFVTDIVHSKGQADVIYTDFSKAFDKVDHFTLVNKLRGFGFGGALLKWIESFLSERTQRVKIGTSLSRPIYVSSGVPQGSHLGPLLFTLFVNDVTNVFSFCRILLYADDMKIVARISELNDCVIVQTELTNFAIWCVVNRLQLNLKKCHVLSFVRSFYPILFNYVLCDSSVERVSHIIDLGVHFSCDLSFRRHIESVILKGRAMLGFILRQSSEFHIMESFITLYVSLVRSQLEYASIIWSPFSADGSANGAVQRLEHIQYKFLKFLFVKLFPHCIVPSYDSLCLLFGLHFLEDRRQVFSASFAVEYLCGRIDCTELGDFIYLVPVNYPPRRNSNLVHVPFYRTVYGQNAPLAKAARLLNTLSEAFFPGISKRQFKNRAYELCSLRRRALREI